MRLRKRNFKKKRKKARHCLFIFSFYLNFFPCMMKCAQGKLENDENLCAKFFFKYQFPLKLSSSFSSPRVLTVCTVNSFYWNGKEEKKERKCDKFAQIYDHSIHYLFRKCFSLFMLNFFFLSLFTAQWQCRNILWTFTECCVYEKKREKPNEIFSEN